MILRQGPEGVEEAAQVLKMGGVVAFPTETVYGLGADAFNAEAVASIFEAKDRPLFDPLIVHVASPEDVEKVARKADQRARDLAARFWPGPLTLVLPRHPDLPGIVTAGLDTVAVRMPAHPLALALIRALGSPIAAPSANRFGRLSPTTAAHVKEQLEGRIPLVLDGGLCAVGVESTIVDLSGPGARLLRPGGVPVEEIEALVGPLEAAPVPRDRPAAPGMLESHYAPATPLRLVKGPADPPPGRTGFLAFSRAAGGYAACEVLSSTGDLKQAAARLFAALHALDALGLEAIEAEGLPDEGLGRAVNDRLRRAAAR